MTDPFASMSGAEIMVGFVLSFLIGVGVRGFVDWWRLRRSFVRFRVLDELPAGFVSRTPHMDAWFAAHAAQTEDALANHLSAQFHACDTDPSPKPRRRVS